MLDFSQKEIEQFILEVFKCYHDDGILLTSFESILHPIHAFLPFEAMHIGIIKDTAHRPHRLSMHEYNQTQACDIDNSIQKTISDNILCHSKKLEPTLMAHIMPRHSNNWDQTRFAAKTAPINFNFSSSPYKIFAGIYTDKPMDDKSRRLFFQLMPLLFLKISRAYTDGSIPALTKRQQEVLFWIKEGKTAWDISQLLVVSERTVNFHLDNIFKKLEAVNRPHAVARAISYGLLEP
ncbi:MAG: helix-turn-helix transcriptional regulator [Gammaproteobacteria bacterium]|nr:helix-turn-helix transcriptional regulator [Gammaproteobacteria bacterium]